MQLSRRTFLTASAGAAAAGPDLSSRICLFTDHLGGFTYAEVARMLKDLGVAGPDLTVRRGGLVTPERVAEDLPKAVQIFREHSLTVPMITTTVTSAADPLSRHVLEAASRAGIRYYKLGYFAYKDLGRWNETIEATRGSLKELARLGAQLNLHAGLHNHAGDSVGCCFWDSWEALQGVDSDRLGFFFDPAHATIEGGKSGWDLNFRRISSRLVMVAIKDFVWEKRQDGWRTRWVPLGEGAVNYSRFIPLLKAAAFTGPISLHIEYDPGGKTKTERYDRALEAAQKDLAFLRRHLGAA
ncbi:MAG TPA: sugar phosphate isomerase/epimerase family protein [Bryobacteraceae bacterium]|nr:sugar phosphate isomerase/epimerase family protein [Bryobacteraceae bacterium]